MKQLAFLENYIALQLHYSVIVGARRPSGAQRGTILIALFARPG